MAKAKRPTDPNVHAKLLIDIISGEKPDPTKTPPIGKNPAAVELGRLGGLKGGNARAAKLSAKKRSDIAKKAAKKRWSKKK